MESVPRKCDYDLVVAIRLDPWARYGGITRNRDQKLDSGQTPEDGDALVCFTASGTSRRW
jgi:hypothetical protein